MIRLFFTALLTLCASAPLADPLRIGVESGYRPYVFINETGTRDGFDVDLMALICERGGFECEWIEMPFPELFTALADDRYDIAIGGVSDTPQRDRLVDWTSPYRTNPESVAAFAGTRDISNLKAARISVLEGSVQMSILIKNGYKAVGYHSIQAALDALFADQVDAYFGSSSYLRRLLEEGEDRLIELGTISYSGGEPRIAVSKSNPELRSRLNALLDELRQKGRIDILNRKWFPNAKQSNL